MYVDTIFKPTWWVKCAMLLGIFALAPKSPGQIVNGGFEQPVTATFLQVNAPDAVTISGWKVTAGSVDAVNAAGNGFTVGAADSGAQYLDLNGSSAGTIGHTFSTVPGTFYRLQFAFANNYNPPTSLTAHVTVTGAASLLDTDVVHSTSVSGNLNWTQFDQTFAADQATATLAFQSLSGGQGGVFLDSISVTVAPEPSSAAIAAICSSLFLRRGRKAN